MNKEGYHSFPKKIRQQVKKEQNNCCAYCGNSGCLEVHHIVPSHKGNLFGWDPNKIVTRENAVGLCGGEDGCHRTFDILAKRYDIYFDDVMEDEGRPYTPPTRLSPQEKPSAPIIQFPQKREISVLYGTGDD